MIMSSMHELCVLLLVFCIACTSSQTGKKKNVLFFVADDMRPEIGAYIGPDFPSPIHPKIHTPNLDALAKRSLLLKRAYVQQALCSPSRTSVLTGRRPDTTRVYDLTHYFRHIAGNFTTIPQYFKENGYLTAGMGKVFHPGTTSGGDDPISWTEHYFHAKEYWPQDKSWYSVKDDLLKDKPLVDQQIAQKAVETLQKVAPQAKTGEKPFFVAVGFHRPHLPWVIPESFLSYYPMEDIRLPQHPYLPAVFPEVSWSDFSDLRGYKDMRPFNRYTNMFNMTYPDELVKTMRRAYYSATSYTDSLVGEVIQTLRDLGLENDTIISFWGDHGWQLGEHAEWCKHNNFDLSVHAPMMISIPGETDQGVSTHAITEFVDLYPTLAEAAGLPPVPLCPEDSSQVEVCTEGVSLMPLIKDPARPWKTAAFSQYPRADIAGSVLMGYTMRTDKYRFTEWDFFDYPRFKPHFGGSRSELYDHTIDPGETINHSHDPKYKEVKKELAAQLKKGWRAALPPRYQRKHYLSVDQLKGNVDIL